MKFVAEMILMQIFYLSPLTADSQRLQPITAQLQASVSRQIFERTEWLKPHVAFGKMQTNAVCCSDEDERACALFVLQCGLISLS